MQIGFDNDKYIRIQSQHIKERIQQSIFAFSPNTSRTASLTSATSSIWSLAVNCLTIFTLAEYCPALCLTANCVCSMSFAT